MAEGGTDFSPTDLSRPPRMGAALQPMRMGERLDCTGLSGSTSTRRSEPRFHAAAPNRPECDRGYRQGGPRCGVQPRNGLWSNSSLVLRSPEALPDRPSTPATRTSPARRVSAGP